MPPLSRWLPRSGSPRCTRDSLRFGPNEFSAAEREKSCVASQHQESRFFLESDAPGRPQSGPGNPQAVRRERNPERAGGVASSVDTPTRHSARDEPVIGNALVPDKLSRIGAQRLLKAPDLHPF